MITEAPQIKQPASDTEKVLMRMRDDFSFFAAACLKLVTKAGDEQPLVLNATQRRFLEKIQGLEKAKRPVRLIVPKARQLGISTFIAAYFFWKCLFKANQSALVVADEMADAQSLLAKTHLFYSRMPSMLKPVEKYRSKKELYFENNNSSFQVDTASNSSLGRSRTFQLVHLSEIAFFPNEGASALLSLRQTVVDKPGTYIILESTANGLDNIFYDEVQRALRKETEYEVFFCPWFENPDYALGGEDTFELTDEELQLQEMHKLSFSQLRWRRRSITDKCQGSVDLFKQEYPATLDEAFRYTGHPVFDLASLQNQASTVLFPQFVGNVNLVQDSLEEKNGGKLSIWQFPKDKSSTFVVGADIAEGTENETLERDYSVIQIFNALTKEQVAEYRTQESWDRVATMIVWLAKFYNNAYVVIENNNHGLAVISKVRDLHYPFLYKERDYNETGTERQETVGFRSTQRSKPMLISYFAELFRDGYIRINSKILLDEMSKFNQDKRGRLRAGVGHDDCVMSAALAMWGTRFAPVISKMKVENSKLDFGIKVADLFTEALGPKGEAAWVQENFKVGR